MKVLLRRGKSQLRGFIWCFFSLFFCPFVTVLLLFFIIVSLWELCCALVVAPVLGNPLKCPKNKKQLKKERIVVNASENKTDLPFIVCQCCLFVNLCEMFTDENKFLFSFQAFLFSPFIHHQHLICANSLSCRSSGSARFPCEV